MEVLTKKDFIEMPWKNGGGMTTQLFLIKHPVEDSFLFRLSKAHVQSNGPFSHFPQIDRILMLVEGKGFHLRGDNLDFTMANDKTPLYFEGEKSIECTLLDGPCIDFNVMTERSFAKSLISVASVPKHGPINLKAECDFRFIYDNQEAKLYKLNKDDQCTISTLEPKTLIVIDVSLL